MMKTQVVPLPGQVLREKLEGVLTLYHVSLYTSFSFDLCFVFVIILGCNKKWQLELLLEL